ncbi:uncharacterized protein METZ01_LOCUS474163, partial [marine metagenome]
MSSMIEPAAHGFCGHELEVDGGRWSETTIFPPLLGHVATDLTRRGSGQCAGGNHHD